MIVGAMPIGIIESVGGAAPAYDPLMMTYDGVGGHYSDAAITVANNTFTVIGRFTAADKTDAQEIVRVRNASGRIRLAMTVQPNNHGTPDRRDILEILLHSDSGSTLCRLQSLVAVNTGAEFTFFFSYNSANAAFTFKVNGIDAVDVGNDGYVEPTTGTMPTGSFVINIGNNVTGTSWLNGKLGFFGMRDAYLSNWGDFFETDGSPKELDESGWTEWGAQPSYWEAQGEMDAHEGSLAQMTENATITGPA